MLVDTHSFQDTVDGGNSGGSNDGFDNTSDGFWVVFEVGDEGIKKDKVRKGRHKTTMKTGIVAPETSVGVDRKDCRGNLREQEKQDWDIDWSPGNLKILFLEAVDEPSSANNDCHEIDKNHFVELEDLGGEWPEKERGDKKKNMESFVNEFCSSTE